MGSRKVHIEETGILDPWQHRKSVKRVHTGPGREETWTELIYGDSHIFPGQDDRPLQIVEAIAEDVQPDGVTHIGDLLETQRPSSHPHSPFMTHILQDEINMGATHLARMSEIVPEARRTLLEGNHEYRLTRLIWNLDGAEKTFFELDIFKKEITWPKIMKLEEIGWEFFDYQSQPIGGLPKFLRKHGHLVRSRSGYTAHGEHDTAGMSGASGHSHRLAAVMRSDHNGNHIWLETGCTCSERAWYGNKFDKDWQQGFWIITFDVRTGAFHPEMVYIHNGMCIFRDNIYKAR